MEINPHHPTTQAASNQWHALCALVMLAEGKRHVVITPEIMRQMKGNNIAIQDKQDGIHLRLVTDEEAGRLARMHGGITPPGSN